MLPEIVPATFSTAAFNCPICGAFSHQRWMKIPAQGHGTSFAAANDALDIAVCSRCNDWSLWVSGKLILPDTGATARVHPDMPEDVKVDFEEARAVFMKSPRSSAALLRLALQKLCVHLGEGGKNINEDIGSLVAKGLPIQVQQALDLVRVIGNEQVHPGELDVRDDPQIAAELFNLVNFIVEDRITRPKTIQALYDRLPQSKLQQIERRDL